MPYWTKPATASRRTNSVATHLVLAKVAGFAEAVFGLNSTSTTPVLVSPAGHPGLMLSSLSLSAVRRARYAPATQWRGLWRDLLRWLLFADGSPGRLWTDAVEWVPVVGPALRAQDPLPPGAAIAAVRSSLQWVHTVSGLLPSTRALSTSSALGLWTHSRGADWSSMAAWPTELATLGCDAGPGDGSHGIFEAYMSAIQARGGGVGGNLSTQLVRPVVRTDCVGEAAGALAVGAWTEVGDGRAVRVAANLLDYLLFDSPALASWPRSDPSSSVGGTLLWGTNLAPPHAQTIYADDQVLVFICVCVCLCCLFAPATPLIHLG